MVWARRENVRVKFATKSFIMGTRENTKEGKSKMMVRRMDGWEDGKDCDSSVPTDEDIRDRVVWRALVCSEKSIVHWPVLE